MSAQVGRWELDIERQANAYLREKVAARDRVIEAAFRALDAASCGYSTTTALIAEARRLRAELEEGK